MTARGGSGITKQHRSPSPSGRSPRLARWLIGLVALAALFAAVTHFGEFERFAEMARRARPGWLIVAVLLQLSTYGSVALGWRTVLRRAGAPQPLRRLLPIAFAKLFADQVIPSAGMGGNLLLVERLTRLGTPRGTAVAALLVSMIGFYAAYALLAVAMLVTLWLDRAATPLLVGVVTTFLLVALAIPALALWLRRRGSRPLPAWLEHIPPIPALLKIVGEAPADLVTDRQLIATVGGLNGLVFIADAATLAACLLAIGQPLLPGTAFIALMAGSIAATLAPLPLGLGSFEASCVGMLGVLGVPVEAALAATLLLRTLTLWLPLLPGLALLRGHRRKAIR